MLDRQLFSYESWTTKQVAMIADLSLQILLLPGKLIDGFCHVVDSQWQAPAKFLDLHVFQ